MWERLVLPVAASKSASLFSVQPTASSPLHGIQNRVRSPHSTAIDVRCPCTTRAPLSFRCSSQWGAQFTHHKMELRSGKQQNKHRIILNLFLVSFKHVVSCCMGMPFVSNKTRRLDEKIRRVLAATKQFSSFRIRIIVWSCICLRWCSSSGNHDNEIRPIQSCFGREAGRVGFTRKFTGKGHKLFRFHWLLVLS